MIGRYESVKSWPPVFRRERLRFKLVSYSVVELLVCVANHCHVRIQRGIGGPEPLENHKLYGFL